MRHAIISTPAWLAPAAVPSTSEHLGRALIYLGVVAGIVACAVALSALALAATLERHRQTLRER